MLHLSATLTSKADIARAFGRVPEVTIKPVIDAGHGERLVLFSKHFAGKAVKAPLMDKLIDEHKVLIAVPSYPKAEAWKSYGTPPATEAFSDELEKFRKSKQGVFVLVSRMDGIDLPDSTCRVMVIDDLPSGFFLLERFQWEILNMNNFYAAKIANRLTQLFGRINRGRNDYSAFIINGRDLNTWLYRERNLALLPTLLRKQVLIGQALHEEMQISSPQEVADVLNSVIGRNQTWLDFYADSMEMDVDAEASEASRQIEKLLTKTALAEVQFASALWEQDYAQARQVLEEHIEDAVRADTKVAGWHNVWIGLCLEVEGDRESALKEYERARERLERQITLPRIAPAETSVQESPNSALERTMLELVSITSADSFRREMRLLENGFLAMDNPKASPRQLEESIRQLGEAIGFKSTRPDNDHGTGPDVLWLDEDNQLALSFELKTDKEAPVLYRKKEDISQGHDHFAWVEDEHSDYEHLGLIFVGAIGTCSGKANPSDEMYHCTIDDIKATKTLYMATLQSIHSALPIERGKKVQDFFANQNTDLRGLFTRLSKRRMKEMQEELVVK